MKRRGAKWSEAFKGERLVTNDCAPGFWPKLHDMFKACGPNVWQREFPVGFPVEVNLQPVYSGTVFCLLLGVSSDYAQPITGQVTEVTCPVIGRA